MPSLSVQNILKLNCCPAYTQEVLEEIWAGRETLSAAEMYAETSVPLNDRVWAMTQAEPDWKWGELADSLYDLIDPDRYPDAEGETHLEKKFGPDAWTAAHHVLAYAALIGDLSLVEQAESIVGEILP